MEAKMVKSLSNIQAKTTQWRTYFRVSVNQKFRMDEKGMETDKLTPICQPICDHSNQRWYKQRCFDILNGFEIVSTRCINCHKTIVLEIKKIK